MTTILRSLAGSNGVLVFTGARSLNRACQVSGTLGSLYAGIDRGFVPQHVVITKKFNSFRVIVRLWDDNGLAMAGIYARTKDNTKVLVEVPVEVACAIIKAKVTSTKDEVMSLIRRA